MLKGTGSLICLFTDIDFEKISNATCVHDVEVAFEVFEEAKNECKTSKQCKGVLDMDCDGQEKYFLCLERQESNNTIDSCVHMKFIVGENVAMIIERIGHQINL